MQTAHKQLVIGAGPTGLAVAKAFGEAGIDCDHVEATDHLGGNWAHGVYDTTHIVSSCKTTEYSDFPMPAHYPDFPSAAQMCRYFESYAETFGLRDQIQFQTRVDRVEYRDDERWDVHFDDGEHRVYKGLVVCNGHHWAKQFPGWVDAYEGAVIHSKDYQKPEQLDDKRVLVLGGGNSGCDIISEAARRGASAHWSLRRGYWFLPELLFGRPVIEIIKPWMPVTLQRVLLRAMLRIVIGRYEDYGLPEPEHKIFEAHPSVSSEVFIYLKQGRIEPIGDVVDVDGETLVFDDGQRLQFDLVVCATGYEVAFPFLPDQAVPVEGKNPQLYGGLVRPEYRHLYVAGAYQARYGIGPLLRPMALLISDLVELQDQLEVPLGVLFDSLGQDPPSTHLIDPHDAIRRMAIGRKLIPGIKWYARLRGMA